MQVHRSTPGGLIFAPPFHEEGLGAAVRLGVTGREHDLAPSVVIRGLNPLVWSGVLFATEIWGMNARVAWLVPARNRS
jgi:hypothetical protein